MSGLAALRRIAAGEAAGAPPPAEPGTLLECCEFCGAQIADQHGHVADVVDHRLLCVCRPCYLLFAPRGAGGGRYRGVGEEVRRVVDPQLSEGDWAALGIPVELAFFFRQDGRLLAFYPSPGGATESELDLSAWTAIASANPVLEALQPDVEAALLRRHGGRWHAYLVPVDLCYELVGAVRRHWDGLGGGEVWDVIDAWFGALDVRAEEVARR